MPCVSHSWKENHDRLLLRGMSRTGPTLLADSLISHSMGYIYSSAVSVIIALQGPIWNIIETAAAGQSPSPFPDSDLRALEQDKWISRVWTYQELVNGADTYFTTTNPGVGTPVVQVQRF